MNAPWPGPRWRQCVQDGCPGFQRGALARLWRRTVAQVRSVDSDAITWIEPPSVAPAVAPLLLPATGDRRRSGLAFQADCGLAAAVSPAVSGQLVRGAAGRGARPRRGVVGRGGTARPPDRDRPPPRAAPRSRACGGSPTRGCSRGCAGRTRRASCATRAAPASGDNVDEARLRALDAPHPRLVAGTPAGWSLDAATGAFTAQWSTTLPSGAPAGEGAVSELWLGRRHYPGGYRLTLTGARVVRRTADRVVVRALAGAERVTVVAAPVAPAGLLTPRAPRAVRFRRC